jgi:hypothetical protein
MPNCRAPDDGHNGAPETFFERTVSFAIKPQSVASSWPFISTYYRIISLAKLLSIPATCSPLRQSTLNKTVQDSDSIVLKNRK